MNLKKDFFSKKYMLAGNPDLVNYLYRVLDQSFFYIVILSSFSVGTSILHSFDIKNYPLVIIHTFFFCTGFGLFSARNKLTFFQLFLCFAMIIYFIGLGNLLFNGYASISFFIFSLFCIYCTLFYGSWGGVFSLLSSILAILTVGLVHYFHLLDSIYVPVQSLENPITLISQVTTYTFFMFIAILIIYVIQKKLLQSLQELSNQSQKLSILNEEKTLEIEKRKKMTVHLINNEKKYRFISDHIMDVVVIHDIHTKKCIYVSPSVEKMFGFNQQEFLAADDTDLLTSASLYQLRKAFRYYYYQAKENNESIPLMEYEFIHKDQSTFWGEYHIKFIKDNDGKIFQAIGLIRNISVRKNLEKTKRKMEEQLDQSERIQTIGQFASTIAHDFNNMLSHILLNSELLANSIDPQSPYIENITNIIKHSNLAADFTTSLMQFAKKRHFIREKLNFHQLIEEFINLYHLDLHDHVEIELILEATYTDIKGNLTVLMNCLLNIVKNAKEAIQERGKIRIHTYNCYDPQEDIEKSNRDIPLLSVAI
ncbi:MAG: PAS domain S-box protein, partial [Spirochaetes bacterium]|nr:PAS domain S-box protein [Spirochaetota bacterium]